MNLSRSFFFLGSIFFSCTNNSQAFTVHSHITNKHNKREITSYPLYLRNNLQNGDSNIAGIDTDLFGSMKEQMKKTVGNIVAMALFTATCLAQVPLINPAPVYAEDIIKPPNTAIVIETIQSKSKDQVFIKTEIDAKTLAKSIISNRKELLSSAKRISDYAGNELKSGPWLEIGKELINIEGDVVPEVVVKAPTDWQGALKDLAKGRFYAVLNGEILSIEFNEVKGERPGDDEITIRIKGTSATLPSLTDEVEVVQLNPGSDFWDFWNSDSTLLPEGYEATNGQTILGGTAVGIAASYAISYQFYLDVIAKEEAAAVEKVKKRSEMAKKKKQETEDKKKQETKDIKPDNEIVSSAGDDASVESSLKNETVKEVTEENQSVTNEDEVDTVDEKDTKGKKRSVIKRLFGRGK
mmetsp:Transcript_13718/g.15945  ORF Transcript_13718/g.15945 Transcript_13718/m.15945 type:complete len:410 (+) Transcript_13718:77-1306(+)